MRRWCSRCGAEIREPRKQVCDACRKPRHPGRDKRTGRGQDYGVEHRRLRARIGIVVRAGGGVCWRCGLPIGAAEPWDLGHDDVDRSIYRGPEHLACNRATSGRREPPRQSRRW